MTPAGWDSVFDLISQTDFKWFKWWQVYVRILLKFDFGTYRHAFDKQVTNFFENSD